jgi:hypothetical protein
MTNKYSNQFGAYKEGQTALFFCERLELESNQRNFD